MTAEVATGGVVRGEGVAGGWLAGVVMALMAAIRVGLSRKAAMRELATTAERWVAVLLLVVAMRQVALVAEAMQAVVQGSEDAEVAT